MQDDLSPESSILDEVRPFKSETVSIMDIPLEILAMSNYTAISLQGSLQVERGKKYKFCLVPAKTERTKLYIDNILMIDMNEGSNNDICVEKYSTTDALKISVDRFSSTNVNEPLVLQWQSTGKPRSIIPESAWVQVRD